MTAATRVSHENAVKAAIQLRVYYEDTDAAGIIYHANYIKFAERGRTELLRELGCRHDELLATYGLILVVRRIEIDFRSPGYLDDLLDIETEVKTLGNTSLVLTQSINRAGKELAVIEAVIVAMSKEGRALRLPPQLRQIFGSLLKEPAQPKE